MLGRLEALPSRNPHHFANRAQLHRNPQWPMFVTASETFLMRRAALLFLSTSRFRSFLYETASPVRLPASNSVFIIYLSWLQNKRASRHDDCMNAHPHAALLLLHFSNTTNYFKEHSRTQPDSKPFFLLCNVPPFSFVLSEIGRTRTGRLRHL